MNSPALLFLGGLLTLVQANAAQHVTFTKDVAPILFENCATCHRPGEIGPFPLLSYADAKKRARLIVDVTEQRLMPPWKPEKGHGEFSDERRLTESQIATLKAWLADGTPEGNPRELPSVPKFKSGWQLGEPDIVLKMPEAFTIPAEGRDVYIHFVFPLNIEKEIHIRGVECRPGNRRVAHHAAGLLDASGKARKLDAQDSGMGYENFGSPGFVPAGFTPGYVPGQTPRFFADGSAITVKKGTDFVLQMHYHPSGKEETDQTEIGLYLTKIPPTRHMLGVLLSSEEIDIPPGSDTFQVSDKYTLPVDFRANCVWAHMHLIGKEVNVWAELPDGTTRRLLKIGDWDFNWQDTYRYQEDVLLPKGTVLRAQWRFDNTDRNPRNPNHPPKRVQLGEGSTDEMTGIWLGGEMNSGKDLLTLLGVNLWHYGEIKKKGEKFGKER